YEQNFGRFGQVGNRFNFMAEAGYDFSIDEKRTQYLVSCFHLDYDVGNLHRFYPLAELNWFYDVKQGNARDLTFEGADLINFGSRDVTNRNLVSLDFGLRYKFCESVQLGAVIGFPVSNSEGLQKYRLTFDMIFRY